MKYLLTTVVVLMSAGLYAQKNIPATDHATGRRYVKGLQKIVIKQVD